MAYYCRLFYSSYYPVYPAQLPLTYDVGYTLRCASALDLVVMIGRFSYPLPTWPRGCHQTTGAILAHDDPGYSQPEPGDVVVVVQAPNGGSHRIMHRRALVIPAGARVSRDEAQALVWDRLDTASDFRTLAAQLELLAIGTLG